MDNYEIMKVLFKKYGHENILFIGFDVGKYKHVGKMWDGYKDVHMNNLEFSSNENGYKILKDKLDMVIKNMKPKCMIFGCEPSSTYYLSLMNRLCDDYPDGIFRLVNPKATAAQRDASMERGKTDFIDASAILELLIQGNSYNLPLNDPVYDEIKETVRWIDRLTKEQSAIKTKVHLYINELYPGFEPKDSKMIDTIAGMQFLTIIPDPKILKRLTAEEMIELFKQNGYKLKDYMARRYALRAKNILLSNKPTITAKIETLKCLVKQFHQNEVFMSNAETTLAKLLEEFNFTTNILNISGIGVKSLGRIIAYPNNPYRFNNAAQVAQFAGLTPRKNESGTISKREKQGFGHSRLRSTAIQLAHQLISTTGYFTAFYNRLVVDKGKDINLAVAATAHKIIRVLYKMMITGEEFKPPTIDDDSDYNQRIERFTKKKKEALQKRNESPHRDSKHS